VQLKTASKMFCRCDNNSEGKAPNTVVCPVCLAMPGALPVANKQAIEWTIKTGLRLGCQIPKIAKFDRKHYFYPDLPKGYQISQYDEPFAIGGAVEIGDDDIVVRINRVHLEEDAGKLIHRGNKSFVDLNRAGTPLMEIVTEPDITSPEMAGTFLRKLQKIVRDEVAVSEASMEKGHLRCDANISVADGEKMSQIIEIKNINSFKFVEKALGRAEIMLRKEYQSWPEKLTKETWGYDSLEDKIYLQRKKEGSADYRYFPEPDLPPFDSSVFDLDKLKNEVSLSVQDLVKSFVDLGVGESEAKVLANDRTKLTQFEAMRGTVADHAVLARAIVQNYFGSLKTVDQEILLELSNALNAMIEKKIDKQLLSRLSDKIVQGGKTFTEALAESGGGFVSDNTAIEAIVDQVLAENQTELTAYKAGKTALYGFFVGQVMKKAAGKASPQVINTILKEKL